jgi:NAD(P)-dependent dehydrogenase (short-subunit alcohol dehydrogenase family)
MGKFTTLAEVDEATYDTIFNVNTKAVLFGIKAAAAAMKKAGTKGSILVTSSVLGHRVVERFATAGVYSASKAAVEVRIEDVLPDARMQARHAASMLLLEYGCLSWCSSKPA